MGQCSIPSCYSKLAEINCGNRRVIINNQDSLLGEGSSASYSREHIAIRRHILCCISVLRAVCCGTINVFRQAMEEIVLLYSPGLPLI